MTVRLRLKLRLVSRTRRECLARLWARALPRRRGPTRRQLRGYLHVDRQRAGHLGARGYLHVHCGPQKETALATSMPTLTLTLTLVLLLQLLLLLLLLLLRRRLVQARGELAAQTAPRAGE